MNSPDESTDSARHLPEATDARWRSQVLCELAERLASSFPCDAAVAHAGTPSAWLSVSKDGVEVGRVFANRGHPDKERTKYTVIAGSPAAHTDCYGTSKVVWLLKRAASPLQEGDYESLLPQHLAYLQPLSERGDSVRCDMDLLATVESLTDGERGDLVELYRQVVALDHKEEIDAWLSDHSLEESAGKLENLLFLFDGLIRLGLMPDDLAHYRVIEMDEGTHDQNGWEW